MVADPALDLGLLLYSYVPENEWDNWLQQYGLTYNKELSKRMHWYVVSHTISIIVWHIERNQLNQVVHLKEYLGDLLQRDE